MDTRSSRTFIHVGLGLGVILMDHKLRDLTNLKPIIHCVFNSVVIYSSDYEIMVEAPWLKTKPHSSEDTYYQC